MTPPLILNKQTVTGRGSIVDTNKPTNTLTVYFVFPTTLTALTIDFESGLTTGIGQTIIPFPMYSHVFSAAELAAGAAFVSLNPNITLPGGQNVPLVTQISVNIMSFAGVMGAGVDAYLIYLW
jgi:hypothetical protein